MADRGNHGYRRGDRGRGGGEGGSGHGRGGFDRGDYGGGHGGYRGGFSGFRGDSSQGGGRAQRGRRDASPGISRAFSYGDAIPAPNAEVAQLETQIVARQSASLEYINSQMVSMNVKGKKRGGNAGGKLPPPMNDRLPARPAFGSQGRPVVLWTNYLKVNFTRDSFFKYTIEVEKKINKPVAPQKAFKGGGKASSKPARNTEGPEEAEQTKEVRGRELFLVIKATLAKLLEQDKTFVAASEFKSQIITLKKIDLVENPIVIQVPRDGGDDEAVDTYNVHVHGPNEIDVGSMKKYLVSSADEPATNEDVAFPRFPEAINALNIIFGHRPRSDFDNIGTIGSHRFFPFGDNEVIEQLTHNWHALTAARGYFQSTRLATGRILLNVNVTHGVFRISGSMAALFDSLGLRVAPKSDFQAMKKLRAFGKFLPKARAWRTMIIGGKKVRRSKALQGLVTPSDVFHKGRVIANPPKFDRDWEFAGPKNVQFWKDGDGGGQYITVFDYYKQTYGITLGDYPLIDMGSDQNPFTYIPAEMVELQPGQAIKATLTMEETTAILEFACRSPYSNALSISAASHQALDFDDRALGNFGLSVDKTLLTVQGRILKAPTLSYIANGRRAYVIPAKGQWNMRSLKIVKPGKKIERWTWVNLMAEHQRRRAVDKEVVIKYGDFLVSMGIAINKNPINPFREVADPSNLDNVFGWLKKNDIQLFVIILPEKDSTGLYSKIKTLGDCTYGIHTSCVVAEQFAKANPAYFANVGLKINLKAGGTNHKLQEEFGILKDGKAMIAGYDVTHPTNVSQKEGNETPSLAGFVSSIDKDLAQWPALSWEQPPKQEVLTDKLLDAFTTRLDTWSRHNRGRYPENIVIYRDGVSESQFPQVLDDELPIIREACRKKYPANQPRPKLTILVAVKRHQTRFYPTSADDMSKSGNIINGTVVDRGVTQARYWDFFMTAYEALQGTARPAHYTVLLDEIFRARFGGKAIDELERLTHELCYLFGRATKAVSICPPAYYADIVCKRARHHRPEHYGAGDDTESMSTVSEAGAGTAGRQVHVNLRDSMYYI